MATVATEGASGNQEAHRQFNHPAPKTLVAILKAGGASKEFIEAAKLAKCDYQANRGLIPQAWVMGFRGLRQAINPKPRS